MRKWIGLSILMIVSSVLYAGEASSKIVLDKIVFQMTERQWVNTQTALLFVNINVTLTTPDLVKARADIMGSLGKIAQGEWHLLEFDRSQDSSGLEKLYVRAQARVNQSALTDIYQNAKKVSIPGAKYEIGGVEFKPSLEEIQVVRANVREALYQKVNDELSRINKAYTNQNYSINQLLFVEGENAAHQRVMKAKDMNVMAMSIASPAPMLTVSNELVLTAFVKAASNRKQGD